jgi:hypothetical protein
MENAVDFGIWTFANGLFKQKERASGTVVCCNHGDINSPSPRHLNLFLELQVDNPSGVNLQLLPHQISRHSTAIDTAVAPGGSESDIMITVEMTEEICVASFHGSISESIYADRKSWEDLVKRTRSLIGVFPTGGLLVGCSSCPCRVFSIP